MAVMKKSTRKKLSKQLNKLIKQHGAEMALALVTGIVSGLAAERTTKTAKKPKTVKVIKITKAEKADRAEGAPVRTVVARNRE